MTNVAQRSFAFGEVAPAYHARVDLALHRAGLRVCRNFVVLKMGGARLRPGTLHKGATKSHGVARLARAVFDEDQNYLLELGVGYVRFWRDGVRITGTSIGSWADTTAYAAGIVLLHSGTYYVCLQAHTSATANDRPNDGTNRLDYWHPLVGLAYELPLPYTTQVELRQLQLQVGEGVVRLAHRSHARRTLTRIADAQWTVAVATSGVVSLDPPANLTTDAPTPGSVASWVVTAVDDVNGVESLASGAVSSDTAPDSPGSIFTESWDAVPGATKYRVYRSDNGSVYGFLRETSATSLIDTGIAPDFERNPPVASADFSVSGDYPGVIGGFQQRVLVSGSTNEPATVRGSRVAAADDFTVSAPLRDTDAVSWTMVGSQRVRVLHFLELDGQLLMFTSVGVFGVRGDESGILAPGAVNPIRLAGNGAARTPAPLEVGTSALFVQARGSLVRDVRADGGDDVTLIGAHLLDGYTIVSWCFQETPHPIIWAVRSDGLLLSLTYQRQTGVLAWARHDTPGTVEEVASVPEATEDAVYLIVNRTIDGGTVRYLERLASSLVAAAALVCADCAATATGLHPHASLSLDFTGALYNAGSNTTIQVVATGSGGTGSFAATDVGRTFRFTRASVSYVATITAYTSPTVVEISFVGNGTAWTNPTVLATGDWFWTSLGALSHLEGATVSVALDGVVHASPNNPEVDTTVTIDNGVALLANTSAFTSAVVGLPITADLRTLALDTSRQTARDKAFNITQVGLVLEESGGCWVGQTPPDDEDAVTGLDPLAQLDANGDATTAVQSGYREALITAGWSTEAGSVFLRHVDPVALTVHAIVPHGYFPSARS